MVDADHLDYYLDEFTFRFKARGLLFFRLLQQAVEPVPYKGLVGGIAASETIRERRYPVTRK